MGCDKAAGSGQENSLVAVCHGQAFNLLEFHRIRSVVRIIKWQAVIYSNYLERFRWGLATSIAKGVGAYNHGLGFFPLHYLLTCNGHSPLPAASNYPKLPG